MFRKGLSRKKQIQSPVATTAPIVKYQRPKILLIDLNVDVRKSLEGEGYNVAVGTFGKPYKVTMSSAYQPVIYKASLPNFTEREIIVLDLAAGEPTDAPRGEKSTPMGELDWWAKCNRGVIDPRPRAMFMVQDQFDRIYQNGGAFIIFSDRRINQKLVFACNHDGLSIEREIPYDNWSFLSILSNLSVTSDFGEEITPTKKESPLVRLLADHLDGASFRCTLEAQWRIEEQWLVLAKNKYGAAVAGSISPPEGSKAGWIFIFPRICSKPGFLVAFFKNVLPDLCPALIPHAEGQRWVHRPQYELHSVLEKALQISAIQDEAAKRVTQLEKAIETERNASRFLYDLLRETGASLVGAVHKALTLLGFKDVIDVDAEMKKAGKDASLREDLRIHDISPVLVIDIKGVAGKPADAEALQAPKHAFIYIQEQKRPDVRGLTIVNHQRLLPPLDRDNDMPFRQEILDNAAQLQLGLITTWDLFRLVRAFCRYSWMPDQVKPLFYRTGRILPIPCHYEYIGRVKQVWRKAFSIQIESGTLKVGDRISIECPVDFYEQAVASLQLNDVNVQAADAGQEIGILRDGASVDIKEGFPVYRIRSA
jgi:hypothetical protein